MLCHWLVIMVCNAGPVVLNHGVLYCVSDCESLCIILCQLLLIISHYAEQVVVNHGVLC